MCCPGRCGACWSQWWSSRPLLGCHSRREQGSPQSPAHRSTKERSQPVQGRRRHGRHASVAPQPPTHSPAPRGMHVHHQSAQPSQSGHLMWCKACLHVAFSRRRHRVRGRCLVRGPGTTSPHHGMQRVGGHTHPGNLRDVAHSRLVGDHIVHNDSHIRPLDQEPRARHEARGQGVLPKGPQMGETKE